MTENILLAILFILASPVIVNVILSLFTFVAIIAINIAMNITKGGNKNE